MTSHALHPVPKLALEEVHDQTIVSALVCFPLLLARDLQREPFELCLSLGCGLGLWLLQNPVQIFVQAIQEEAQEFLSVMLIRSRELRRM